MLGAGTIINPIIKVVTTVAILAAVYFFIVKPTLDTTEDAIDTSFGTFQENFDGSTNLPVDIQGQINEALEAVSDPGSLQNCIQKAITSSPNTDRIQRLTERCVEKFE